MKKIVIFTVIILLSLVVLFLLSSLSLLKHPTDGTLLDFFIGFGLYFLIMSVVISIISQSLIEDETKNQTTTTKRINE